MLFKKKAVIHVEKISLYRKDRRKTGHPALYAALDVLLSYTLLFALTAGSIAIYGRVFTVDASSGVLYGWMAGVEVLLFLFYLLPMTAKYANVIAAAGFLAAFVAQHQVIFSGLSKCGNELIALINSYYGAGLSGLGEAQEGNGTLICFVAALILWWSAVVLLRRGKNFLLLLPPLFFICVELLVGRAPEQKELFAVTVAFLALLSYGNGRGIRQCKVLPAMRVKAVIFTALAAAAGILLACRFGEEQARQLVAKQNAALVWQHALEQQVTEYGVIGGSPGRISNRAPDYKGSEVLSVSTDWLPEENLYLRGYVGDTYQSGNWTNKGQAEFAEAVEKLSGMEESEAAMYLQNRLYETLSNAAREGCTTGAEYRITYLDTKDDYAYLPYQADLSRVTDEEGKMVSLTLEADAMAYRNGQRVLTAEGVSGGSLLEMPSGVLMGEDTTNVEWYYSKMCSGRYLRVPSNLSECHRLGKSLAERWRETYGSFWASDTIENRPEIYAAYLVREELFSLAEYSLSLDRVPFGEDVVAYFLEQSGKGFCQHYASAGVLLLREMGIPARYVTGYVVKPSEFVETGDGAYEALVKDSDAHAWVEVFIPGTGWVPVEVTENSAYEASGYQKLTAEHYAELWEETMAEDYQGESGIAAGKPADESAGNTSGENGGNRVHQENGGEMDTSAAQNDTNDVCSNTEQKDTPNGNAAPDDGKEGHAGGYAGTPAVGAAWILIVLSVAAVVFAVGYFLHVRRRENTVLHQKDYRAAVRVLSSRVNRILWKKGILRRRNLDDKEYRSTVKSGLPGIPEEEIDCYFKILERAAYSDEELTRGDAAYCYNIYRKIKLLK